MEAVASQMTTIHDISRHAGTLAAERLVGAKAVSNRICASIRRARSAVRLCSRSQAGDHPTKDLQLSLAAVDNEVESLELALNEQKAAYSAGGLEATFVVRELAHEKLETLLKVSDV
jgi:hypothetical protein